MGRKCDSERLGTTRFEISFINVGRLGGRLVWPTGANHARRGPAGANVIFTTGVVQQGFFCFRCSAPAVPKLPAHASPADFGLAWLGLAPDNGCGTAFRWLKHSDQVLGVPLCCVYAPADKGLMRAPSVCSIAVRRKEGGKQDHLEPKISVSIPVLNGNLSIYKACQLPPQYREARLG